MREAMLVVHFIGISTGIGIGVTQMVIGITSKALTSEERNKIFRSHYSLQIVGKISLALIVFSGIVLLLPFIPTLLQNGLLLLKLFLVLFLVILILLISSLSKSDYKNHLTTNAKRIETLGKIALITSLIIIIIAVKIFR